MPQAPIFQDIFGIPWAELPPVMQKHYAVRADSDDRVTVEGTLNIRCSWMIRLAAPLLKLLGALVPYNAENVPVTVAFYSGRGENCFHFDRQFHLPGKPVFRFHSRVEPVGGKELVEFMRCGIGWRCVYRAEGKKVILEHRGYVIRFGKKLIPLPLSWLLGKGAAEEEAVDDNTFKMWMSVRHPLFGENYRYEGTFTVTEVKRADMTGQDVLILGGYGNFGKRIAAALSRHGVPVIIAGRDYKKAEALASQLGAKHAAFDAEADLVRQLQELQPGVVINTCGPFQGKNYAAAEACIAAKTHYIDLADGRDFVTGITQLDDTAKAVGVAVVSGASTVPGLSSAVLERYKGEFSVIEEMTFGISPGAKAERGLATTQGILTYVGKPLKAVAGDTATRYGWGDIYRQEYPELGKRWMANCDIPDLDIFPARYGIKKIRFGAGMESSFLHLGIYALSLLVRLGLPLDLPRHAAFLLRASRWFDRFGSDAGGMHVILRGKSLKGEPLERRWFIIAKNGDGPQIPCVPAILLAKRLATGLALAPGAYPCVGLVELQDYLAELASYAIEPAEL